MSATKRDLWPVDFAVERQNTPVTILREQASLVAAKTGNLLTGGVNTTIDLLYASGPSGISREKGEGFRHSFILHVPALEGYRYTLFTVEHDMHLYPLQVNFEFSSTECQRECATEEELLAALREILASEETKRVVNALIAQSQPD